MQICFWRRLIAAASAGLLLVMGGCELSPDVIEACLNNANQAQSISYEMDMLMDMTVLGQQISTRMQGEGSSTADPQRLEMHYTQKTGDITVEGQSYTELSGDQYVQYIGLNGQWMKQTLPASAVTQAPQEAMAIYLEAITRYQKEGEETIAGSRTSKYSAIISGDMLERVLQASGTMDQLQEVGLDTTQTSELCTGLGDLPVTPWADEAAMRAAKIEMNLTEIMQSLFKKIAQTQSMDLSATGLSITGLSLSMTITGYDTVDSIDIPEQVRQKATDYSSLLSALS